MPGSQREVFNAIEEGIEFNWLSLPIKYICKKRVDTVKIVEMQLGSPDVSVRRHPELIPNSENEIKTLAKKLIH